jgi:hypothetical protein
VSEGPSSADRAHGPAASPRMPVVTMLDVLRRMLREWRFIAFIAAVTTLTLVAEAQFGETARLVGLAIGISVGGLLARRWM